MHKNYAIFSPDFGKKILQNEMLENVGNCVHNPNILDYFVENSVETVNNRLYIYGFSSVFGRFLSTSCGKRTNDAECYQIYAGARYRATDGGLPGE